MFELFSSSQTKDKTRTVSSSSSKINATSDENFGTKKARASFGRGFFKLRGGKQTASAPNLGELLNSHAILEMYIIHIFHYINMSFYVFVTDSHVFTTGGNL